MITRPWRVRRPLAVVAGALAVMSCTLLGSREIKQCDTDADCLGNASTGGSKARVMCVDGLCRERPVTDAGTDATDTGTDAAECVTNASCLTPGTICVDGTCRSLTAPDSCPHLTRLGEFDTVYKRDGALIVGVYIYDTSSGAAVSAVERALIELNQSLPVESRIAAILCDKGEKLAQGNGERALKHLSSLKVPVVIGQFEVSELALFEKPEFSPIAVWSTLGNRPTAGAVAGSPVRFLVDELQRLGRGYPDAISVAVARAEALHGPLPGGAKIRTVVNERTEMTRLSTEIKPLLADAGASTGEIPITSFFEGTPNLTDPSSALFTALPHVVVGIGGDEIVQLIDKVEKGGATVWPDPTPKPVWVLTTRGKFDAALLAKHVSALRGRVIGVDFTGDEDHLKAFLSTVPAAVPHPASFDHLYDAMYALAFASLRADLNRGTMKTPFTAADLVRGLDEVFQPDGAPVVTVNGASQFPTNFVAVKANKRIGFTGTTGPWTFPTGPLAGSRRMDTSYYCYAPDAKELTHYLPLSALTDPLRCAQP